MIPWVPAPPCSRSPASTISQNGIEVIEPSGSTSVVGSDLLTVVRPASGHGCRQEMRWPVSLMKVVWIFLKKSEYWHTECVRSALDQTTHH